MLVCLSVLHHCKCSSCTWPSMACLLTWHDRQLSQERFLEPLCAWCLAQEQDDASSPIHWSRHLLACLRAVTEAELLVGARAVTFNPHFLHYCPPSANHIALGAVDQWPPVPALLLLDSFEPAARSRLLQQASNHPKEVWVLRQDLPSPPSSDPSACARLLQAGK